GAATRFTLYSLSVSGLPGGVGPPEQYSSPPPIAKLVAKLAVPGIGSTSIDPVRPTAFVLTMNVPANAVCFSRAATTAPGPPGARYLKPTLPSACQPVAGRSKHWSPPLARCTLSFAPPVVGFPTTVVALPGPSTPT